MKIQNIGNDYKTANLNRQIKPSFGRVWEEHVSWGANYVKKTGKTNFKLFSFPDAKAVFVEVADKAAIGLSSMKERIVQIMGIAGMGLTITNVLPKDEESKVYPMRSRGDGRRRKDRKDR